MHTVDLATGREPTPGQVEVQDTAVHEAATKAERLFPWTDTRQVAFINSKDCNVKAAYDLLRAGDNAGALRQSRENVETCKSDPKLNHQADAWHNLGIAYFVADDYDNALQAITEANRLHPNDKTILDALAGIRQQIFDSKRAAEIDTKQTLAAVEEQSKSKLTNETIIGQVKDGSSAELIQHEIASQPAKFSVTPADLSTPKKAGVPDSVIAAMLDKK